MRYQGIFKRRPRGKIAPAALSCLLVLGLQGSTLGGAALAMQDAPPVRPGPIRLEAQADGTTDAPVDATNEHGKSEVIYASLRGDGSVKDIYVVNRFEPAPGETVEDYGAYSAIEPLTLGGEVTQQGDALTVRTGDAPFFYQGKLEEAELPWLIHMGYRLNGKETEAAALSGATGELELQIDIEHNPRAREAAEGTNPWADKLMLQISITVPGETAHHLEAVGGQINQAGSDYLVSFMGFPGEKASTFVLRGNVVNFYLPSFQIAAVPIQMDLGSFEDKLPDLSENEDIRELKDGTRELADGSRELADGVSELAGGAHDLADGTAELREGIRAYKDGVRELADGTNTLKGGARELADGTRELADGTAPLTAGGRELADGFRALTEGLQQLVDGAATMKAGADELVTGGQTLHDEAPALQEGLTSFLNGLDRLAEQGGQLASGTTSSQQGAEQLAAGLGESAAGLETFTNGVNGYVNGVNQFLDQVTGGLDGMTGDLAEGVDQLRAGAETFGQGLATLADQGDALVAASAEILEGMRAAGKALDQLPLDELRALKAQLGSLGETLDPDALTALSQGLNGLIDGMLALQDETAGLPALKQAADGLYDGLGAIIASLEKGGPGDFALTPPEVNLEGMTLLDPEQLVADGVLTPEQLADPAVQGLLKYLDEKQPEIVAGLTETIEGQITPQIEQQVRQYLESSMAELLAGLKALRDGTADRPGPARALKDGLAAILAKLPDVARLEALRSGVQQLFGTLGDLSEQLGGLGDLLTQLEGFDGLEDLDPSQYEAFHQGLTQYVEGVKRAKAGFRNDDERSGLYYGIAAFAEGLEANEDLAALEQGAHYLKDVGEQLNTGGPALLDGQRQLASGAKDLSGGLSELVDGVTRYTGGVRKLSEQREALTQGVDQYIGGVDRFADGVSSLRDGLEDYRKGVENARTGSEPLAAGADDLADGLETLGDGAGALADGATELADGITELATGAGELSTGADDLRSGAGDLADGATELADGTDELSNGSRELADGAKSLADGVSTMDERMEEMIDSFLEDLQDQMQTDMEALPSFVSEKNLRVGHVQFVLMSEAIPEKVPEAPPVVDPEPKGFWERFLDLFRRKD